jgi:hypothetical protein
MSNFSAPKASKSAQRPASKIAFFTEWHDFARLLERKGLDELYLDELYLGKVVLEAFSPFPIAPAKP